MSKAKARVKEPSTGRPIASSRQTTNALMQLGLSSTSMPPGHAANRNCTVARVVEAFPARARHEAINSSCFPMTATRGRFP
jgi:hypothetical protein